MQKYETCAFLLWYYILHFPLTVHARIQKGGGGQGVCPPPPTPEKSQKYRVGFLAILVRIPWKITKLPSQHSMLGHHPHTSETPFAGGTMNARLGHAKIFLDSHPHRPL